MENVLVEEIFEASGMTDSDAEQEENKIRMGNSTGSECERNRSKLASTSYGEQFDQRIDEFSRCPEITSKEALDSGSSASSDKNHAFASSDFSD